MSTPFFTWTPVAGAISYFVVVAKDQNFSNIVDEGFTWSRPTHRATR